MSCHMLGHAIVRCLVKAVACYPAGGALGLHAMKGTQAKATRNSQPTHFGRTGVPQLKKVHHNVKLSKDMRKRQRTGNLTPAA